MTVPLAERGRQVARWTACVIPVALLTRPAADSILNTPTRHAVFFTLQSGIHVITTATTACYVVLLFEGEPVI